MGVAKRGFCGVALIRKSGPPPSLYRTNRHTITWAIFSHKQDEGGVGRGGNCPSNVRFFGGGANCFYCRFSFSLSTKEKSTNTFPLTFTVRVKRFRRFVRPENAVFTNRQHIVSISPTRNETGKQSAISIFLLSRCRTESLKLLHRLPTTM